MRRSWQLRKRKAQRAVKEKAREEKKRSWGKKPRANVTDPDSRLLHTRTGWCQGMNCQLSVSMDGLVLSARATQDYTDVHQYQPTVEATVDMLKKVGERTGRDDLDIGLVLADAGYDSNANLSAPGPTRLIPCQKGFRVRQASQDEPVQGDPPPEATIRQAMNHRLRTEEGIGHYRSRAPMIESVNAWLKDRRGLRRFACRGLEAVNAELCLAAAVTNLLKIRTAGLCLTPA